MVNICVPILNKNLNKLYEEDIDNKYLLYLIIVREDRPEIPSWVYVTKEISETIDGNSIADKFKELQTGYEAYCKYSSHAEFNFRTLNAFTNKKTKINKQILLERLTKNTMSVFLGVYLSAILKKNKRNFKESWDLICVTGNLKWDRSNLLLVPVDGEKIKNKYEGEFETEAIKRGKDKNCLFLYVSDKKEEGIPYGKNQGIHENITVKHFYEGVNVIEVLRYLFKQGSSKNEDDYQLTSERDTVSLNEEVNSVDIKIQLATENAYKKSIHLYNEWKKSKNNLYDTPYDDDQYISMTIINAKEEKDEYEIENLLSRLKSKEYRHAVLFGEGGMGKTTSCMRLMDIFKSIGDKIPIKPFIYMPLSAYSSEETLQRYIINVCGILKIFDIKPQAIEVINYYYDLLINKMEMVLLLDGFNEMDSAHHKKFKEELDKLASATNIQILITSREDVTLGITSSFNKLKFKPIDKDLIDSLFTTKISTDLYPVLNNPMMLKIYKYDQDNEMSKQNKDEDYIKNPTSAGEILWNFIGHQIIRSKRIYENTGFGNILFRYLLPYIAYKVEIKEKENYIFKLADLDSYIYDLEDDFKQKQKNRNKPNEFISIQKTLGQFLDDKDRTTTLSDICEQKFSIIKKVDKHTYEFIHQHFRDVFAATHIKNQMALNDKTVFTERIFPFHLVQMLSDILQEHKDVKNEGRPPCCGII